MVRGPAQSPAIAQGARHWPGCIYVGLGGGNVGFRRFDIGNPGIMRLNRFVHNLLGNGVLRTQRQIAFFREPRQFRIRLGLCKSRPRLLERCLGLRKGSGAPASVADPPRERR